MVDIIGKTGCELLTIEEDYVNTYTSVIIKCSCGEIFKNTVTSFLNNGRVSCNKCNEIRNGFKSHQYTFKEEYDKVFNYTNGEYELVEPFDKPSVLMYLKHNLCGTIFKTRNGIFFNRGSRCPKCMHQQRIKSKYKTNEKFLEDFNEENKKRNFEYQVLEIYKGVDTPIKFRHNVDTCSNEFYMKPTKFLNGHGCSKCNKPSKGESKIKFYLMQNNIHFKHQHGVDGCFAKYRLSFDFAIFNNKEELCYLIEYQGKQHYCSVDFGGKGLEYAEEQFKKTIEYDRIKLDFCNKNNINLVHIPYWEFKNIDSILEKLIKDM